MFQVHKAFKSKNNWNLLKCSSFQQLAGSYCDDPIRPQPATDNNRNTLNIVFICLICNTWYTFNIRHTVTVMKSIHSSTGVDLHSNSTFSVPTISLILLNGYKFNMQWTHCMNWFLASDPQTSHIFKVQVKDDTNRLHLKKI